MIRLGCTALGRRIVAFKTGRDNTTPIGNKEDVTSDALKALIDFIGIGETHIVTVDGKPVFSISVDIAGEQK